MSIKTQMVRCLELQLSETEEENIAYQWLLQNTQTPWQTLLEGIRTDPLSTEETNSWWKDKGEALSRPTSIMEIMEAHNLLSEHDSIIVTSKGFSLSQGSSLWNEGRCRRFPAAAGLSPWEALAANSDGSSVSFPGLTHSTREKQYFVSRLHISNMFWLFLNLECSYCIYLS